MYKNILVPIALDENRDGAGSIAIADSLRAEGGKITLLHVVEDFQGYVSAELPEDLPAKNRAYANASLDKVARQCGVDVETKVISGHASRAILDAAHDMGADCIVLASHRPGLGDYLIGSNAARVVRHAACSVHVIR